MDQQIETTIAALKKHRFDAVYTDTAEEAKKLVMDMIPPDANVGAGGSVTIRAMGLVSDLEERGNQVFDHTKPGLSPEEKRKICRSQLTSDVFITGTNALTVNGELVNIDGAGNRVASMTYGPDKVIVVVGKNKLVEDIEAGFERIRAIAGPQNAKRLKLDTPCTIKGYCQNCNSPSRICNASVVTSRKPWGVKEMTVVIVGEDLGF